MIRNLGARLFRRQPQKHLDEELAEAGQTKVRLAALSIIAVYTATLGVLLAEDEFIAPWATTILVYHILYAPAAFAIFLWARHMPGHYPVRRLLSMVLDYVSLGCSIVVEPMVMMPLHTIILWVTLGNGLRFGKTYLRIATGFAVCTVLIVGFSIPQGQNAPYMMVMLLLSAVVIPHYASALLGRIEQARREADEANLAKSRFLAQASHDLRQPLHAINLFTNSLQNTGLNNRQRQIVERIDRALQSLARLFRSLLDLSTLDSGTVAPKLEPVSLGELFQEIVLQNVQLAEWDNSELRMVDTRYVVLTDRVLLLTMIQNLVSNALKFSTGRGVILGCRRRGSSIAVEVWDQGNGIEEEYFSLIFDEFFQIRQRGDRDRQGVGLGLSIVARMAAILGLKVDVASRIGRGSRFTLSGLPIVQDAKVTATLAPSGNDRSPLRDWSVLLVEDDTDILEATAGLLSSWGCHVVASTSIPATIQSCDMIVTDFDLGGGQTGEDCIKSVRKLLGVDVPAIIISAHDDNRITAEIGDPNVLVLKKPLRPAELRSTISSVRARLNSG